ncbi:MAG: nucleotidyltransferase domain-containing protein [Planctomycetaceae bacterium]|jgi:predicted nucleotidyltransferase|nr:nucleotidyltransferase domain-containing protein [Planctomycetaceae bacterium]
MTKSNLTIESVLDELVTQLKTSEQPLLKIVLFGSYANGTAKEDSDIDLMVVIDNDDVLKTYDERMKRSLSINRLMRSINYQYALDVLVYSRKELSIVKEFGNDFINEVEQTGRVLYEKAS